MGVVDILIVLGVFAAFGFLILAKMKTSNPKRHTAITGFFKQLRKEKVSEPLQPPKIVPTENARIM